MSGQPRIALHSLAVQASSGVKVTAGRMHFSQSLAKARIVTVAVKLAADQIQVRFKRGGHAADGSTTHRHVLACQPGDR